MIVVHATFPIDPDNREQALELARKLAEHSRDEDGIVEYRVTTDIDDPNVLRFVERYENEEAFEAHAETDHFREFESVLPDLLTGEPKVVQFDVDSATDVEL
ncbi:putative quinol monooxygenase [Halopelagius longus]|uniref:Antibiotic biosynthesis monooxygenase n=1 Tax=Halopelagius longus TaxID=1236180 RepID=A0A1H1GSD8_9EURY|nr:putative quinol monooxygenase [Halopelagius longus]RDI69509.1 antibiotic biosynthesis monooxygenase [Halopelagius longus]SDR16090.1 Quinol monooxygenase YgiN [Halopelagius longus]